MGCLKKGETVEWKQGNLICVKKPNEKFRITLEKSASVLKHRENKWIYDMEFDYIGEPDNYKMIVHFSGKSRLLDLLKGVYLTDDKFFVKKKSGEKSYLAIQVADNKKVLLSL